MNEAKTFMGAARRMARARWRACFLAYAALLTTATHWPALELGTEEVPAADKPLHLYAFALLTVFLWKTEWIGRASVTIAAALGWVALDELTQALPILDRQFSMLDVISSALGVLVAGAWIGAFRQRGGIANRTRLALQRSIQEQLLGAPAGWRAFLAWALIGTPLFLTGLGLVFALPVVIVHLPSVGPALAYGAFHAALIGAFVVALDKLASRVRGEIVAANMCPACEQSAALLSFDARGWSRCLRCGGALHRGAWLPAISPDSVQLRRFMQWPAAIAICILGAGVGIFYLAIALYTRAVESGTATSATLRAARAVHELPDDFILTVDVSLLLIAIAAMTWVYRGAIARWHDRQHQLCRRCGYDVAATPTERGVGRCPECGTLFANFDAEPARIANRD
jgi:ribosomal protein L37AE/L43A